MPIYTIVGWQTLHLKFCISHCVASSFQNHSNQSYHLGHQHLKQLITTKTGTLNIHHNDQHSSTLHGKN